MKWKHVLIGYLLLFIVGVGIIVLVPTPPVADAVGSVWEFVTLILLLIFLTQKGIQLFTWIKNRPASSSAGKEV